MDESISLLSFSLDQVIDANGVGSLEYVSSILDPAEVNLDQTYFVVTSDQLNIINQLEAPIYANGLEISRISGLNQGVNFVSLDQAVESDQRNVVLDHLAVENQLSNGLPKSSAEINAADLTNTLINNNNIVEPTQSINKNRNTVIKVVGKLNETAEKPISDALFNHSLSFLDQSLLGEVKTQTEVKKKKKSVKQAPSKGMTPPDINIGTENKVNTQKSETSQSIWKCGHCPELSFPTKNRYDRHRWKHHKPPPKIYNCTECELTFELASRLKSHMLSVHLHYKPHKCDICGKTFSKLSDSKKHKNIHLAIKEYACPTCNKQFADMSNLERHKATHAEEKPFKCKSCGKRYMQLSSLKKHRTKSQAALLGPCGSAVDTVKQYHCRKCGEFFKYKKLLAEHDKKHRAEEANKMSDVGRNVDALIQDILQGDAIPDLMQTEKTIHEMQHLETIQSEDLAVIHGMHETKNDNHDENSFEIELINEIDRLEGLTTEAEGVSTSSPFQLQADFFTGSTDPQMNFNTNSQYINQFESLPVVKDENIYNVAGGDVNFHNMRSSMESLPEDLLMPRETEIGVALADNRNVDDCATIFESDVDLETSSNLAANLNQLIAENNVEFVSTEDDDTFIINLNSGIDAEQLSDLLNIGIEVVEPTPMENANVFFRKNLENSDKSVQDPSNVITSSNNKGGSDKKLNSKKRPYKTFSCKLCMKTFNKRDNYVSHMGLHDPMLSRHKCVVCKRRFGYRSTLNKHMLAAHTPTVWTSFQCELCAQRYRHKWMLKAHIDRVHNKITPYRCTVPGCHKMFNKLSDFMYHQRSHLNVRPYKCNLCNKRFIHASHRTRHRNRCAEQTYRRHHKVAGSGGSKPAPNLCSIEMSKELLSDIDDLLKSKMSTASTLEH